MTRVLELPLVLRARKFSAQVKGEQIVQLEGLGEGDGASAFQNYLREKAGESPHGDKD